jgi:PAS domain S-box-containing protein
MWQRRLIRCSQLAAWAVAATGTLVLLRWVLDVQLLQSVLRGFATMKANTALCFLLVGTAAAQLHSSGSARSRRNIQLAAAAVLLFGALTLAESILGLNLHIDQLLFSDSSGLAAAQFPGRMSSATALNFILLGSALLILASQRPALQRLGDTLTYAAALIAFIGFVGHLYGAPGLYHLSVYSSMAVHTALLFIVLAVALLTAAPIRGIPAQLVGDDIGATLARSLFPMAVIVPPAVEFIRRVGQQRAVFNAEVGDAVFATLTVIIFVVVIYIAVASMRATDLQRRAIERALRESEQRFQLFINNAPDYATLMLDPQGRISSWNEGARRLKGYTAKEILGQHFSRFYTPEDLATDKPAHELVRAQAHGTCEDEGWRVRKDGSRFWAGVVIVALKDDQGRLRGFAKITHDLTERKRIEDARRESEQRYRFLAETMPQIIWTAKPDGNVDYYNQQWYAYTGLTFEQSRDWGWKLAVHPDDVQNSIDRWTRAFLTGSNYEGECRFRRAVDGAYRWHLGRAFPLHDRDRAIIQWVGTFTDIDDQKRAEARLQGAYATLEERVLERTSELAATLKEREVMLLEIHHRVKNNLQVISSLISMQVREVADGPSRIALQECQARIQTIALIHEKLYQSKDYSQVPFSEYASTLAVNIFQAAGVSPAVIALNLQIEPLSLAVDKAIPCGLLLNELLTNALKHAFPNGRRGTVRVVLRTVGDREIVLAVSDDGIGLSTHFQPAQSNSLGMQLVTTLVAQLDGRLEIARSGETTFSVTFPVGEMAPAAIGLPALGVSAAPRSAG